MVGRDGGKAKPLKQPKKGEKVVTEEDVEFKKKMVWNPEIYLFHISSTGRGEEEVGCRCEGNEQEVDISHCKPNPLASSTSAYPCSNHELRSMV
jgi:hypothetical protein